MKSVDRRVRRLIRHAYENVPYYRQHFDTHRIRPEDIRGAEDLSIIPVSSKQDLQRDASAFLARGSEPTSLIRHTTSGSTGQPVAILNSVAEQHEVNIGRWRLAYYYGTRPGARAAWVAITRPSLQLERRLLRLLTASRLYRQKRVSCLLPPTEILRQLREFRPSSINGFPGVIAQVAQVALEIGCTDLQPEYVGVGGEVVTPAMRKSIGEAFGAPVYDVYASHELGVTAYQCRYGPTYHVRDDAVVTEILADGGPVAVGQSGGLIGTNLNAFTMPFIRYVIGDVVTRGPDCCTCGATSPTITAIEGRALDYFRLPDGRTLHPFSFNLGLTPWIRNFSMVQERSDLITAYVVASSERTGDQVSELEHSVRRVLGPRVSFRMQFVDTISPAPSGKFRPYRGLAPQGSGGTDT